jgi:hypothetical protein
MKRSIGIALAMAQSLAVTLWLGGIVALGAITAPIVFDVTPMPQSADAMTLVFRRFDVVAMSCAAVALAAEAVRAILRVRAGRLDTLRATVVALAAAFATYEGASLSPRIVGLHASGAIRGMGVAGVELSRLHDIAEACGKAQVALLLLMVALQVLTWTSLGGPTAASHASPSSHDRGPNS